VNTIIPEDVGTILLTKDGNVLVFCGAVPLTPLPTGVDGPEVQQRALPMLYQILSKW
jgi:hypothetical protein